MADTDQTEAAPTQCEAMFRQVVEACLSDVDAEIAVFLTSGEPGGPHGARVALRRLTTCLDAFAPILRKGPRRHYRAQAKQIFRKLGPVRDSDVHLASRADAEGHADRLAANLELREQTRAKFRKEKVVTFAAAMRGGIVPGAMVFRQGAVARALRAAPLRPYAQGVLDDAWQRCLFHGLSVRAMKPAKRHEFRKDMKAMRYLAEFFASEFPGLGAPPFDTDFRSLQDALGILNDHQVALRLEKSAKRKLPKRVKAALDLADEVWCRLAAANPP